MDSQRKEIAQILLDTESVKVKLDDPFTWTSGIRSPIYCDNRRLISFPEAREMIVKGLLNLCSEFEDIDCIAGTATAGIPWASFVAQYLGKPMVYVRSKPKGHGAGKQVEGVLDAGNRVVIVEDLLSTGGSAINSAEALKREWDVDVVGVVAIFSYGLETLAKKMKAAGLEYMALSDFTTLSALLVEKQEISPTDEARLIKFAEDPETWFANLA
ncbi:orotate phosphoribosyltransferase [Candidatus Peregrinibacteria bacterium CG11_big_fil_rev_8_21_14_0_20_41_10]|nr:MAG: orotate phosphoribosyltransferase [Candidatus Peregrinibacteria bacterium CG11_big_fil_rev_8_21_14_0_20_41_10]PIZ76721.1 MAG: orotate phosphoribosyltransferase [Candidatus Peregrinibacteria bacterium CG_4_10_14_0_2_um_filter_41_8]PJC38034.1 MAG: orotate phosphoribosyltransferase [Candidatus Peregrinibacteria bacterium CG_4_9_14_0_2_um_filter_41_14]